MGDTIKNEHKSFNLAKHPILMLGLICLCSAVIFGTKPFSGTGIIFLLCVIFFIIIITFSQSKTDEKFKVTAVKSSGYAILFFIGYCIISIQQKSGAFLFLFAVFLAVIYGLYCYINDTLDTKKVIMILFILAFALKLAYVLYTTVHQRQHDVENFDGASRGHAAYILYILNHWYLPDFDVRMHWQFYHPPLHHFIAAIWLKIQSSLGIATEASYEGLQYLSLFYSSISMYLSYRIMQELRLRRTGLIVAFAIVAFHPTFIILAGSVNNDILSVAFMLGAILNTLVWYKNQTIKNILKIALCIGLGMLTKLSVWMVAPAVAIVFIIVLIQNRDKFKKLILQMLAFGVVSIPIGLFWSVRNYLMYKVPFTYVPELSKTSSQYIGNYSVLDRLFDFNFSQFESVYTQFVFYSGKYFEYNPTIALFKTAMFDEVINDTYYPEIKYSGIVLFWSGVVLALLGFIAIIYMLIRKKSMKPAFKVFFATLTAIILASYYIFCFKFPFTCTQDVRYVVPLITVGAVFIGLWLTKTLGKKTKSVKVFQIAVCAITVCFCISSAITYTLIGI
ncbi:MAG: glycosyltransferase family 39 protein [Candidatus Pseudoruminococcus sp.]|nr:glycosyltransferase family 39 protein [Ruminococcus sp.]MDY2781784.1 glycosyltransferase family 39 protein [Candidatus Pseudoruminococcus sp.]